MTPNETDDRIGPWGAHPLAEGEEVEIRLGPLTLHFARVAGEVRLAHTRSPLEPADEGGGPDGAGVGPGSEAAAEDAGTDELDWSRWAGPDWTGEVVLAPAFPDRPVVVAPEEPFHVLAGAEARIYVRVPLWVKIEAPGRTRRTPLATLPTMPASDTWWGTVEEGELCYWLTTHARRRLSDDLFEPHLAMCPLELVNRSEDDLNVDKIALRVAYLGLYADGSRIWADETRVRYQGDPEGSRLDMAGKAPAEAPGSRLLAEPRLRMARGFKARTFARLRSMQGWMT